MQIITTLAFALALGSMAFVPVSGSQKKKDQKDPPHQFEGVLNKVEQKEGKIAAVHITVREKQATMQEDVFVDVDKDYRFKVNESTKFFGINGKPDPEPVKSLDPKAKPRVRVDAKEEVAVDIRVVPPKDEPK